MTERSPSVALQPLVNHDQAKSPSGHPDPRLSSSRTGYTSPQKDDVRAEKLKKPAAGSTLGILIEVLLSVVTLCFLALAGLAVWLKDKPTGSKVGHQVEEAMKLGPTIYPIVFAALLSRSLKTIGRYKAQKGTRLLSLWTLMNSNSVSDPIAQILRTPKSALIWSLLLLWTMSPLGGQGSLRLIYRTNSTDVATEGLRYWDSGPVGNLFAYTWIGVDNDGSYPLSMRDVYMTGLMQSTNIKIRPLDQWGNVKIPRLPKAHTSSADPEGWFHVAKNASRPEEYSSLFGLPIVGLSDLHAAKTQFTVETTYVEVSCPQAEFININDMSGMNRGMDVTCPGCNDGNGNVKAVRTNALLGPPAPGPTEAEQANATYTQPRSIQFTSSGLDGRSQVTCPVTQRLVETFIECIEGNCAATKIRPSVTDHRSANYTSFDYWATVVLDMISSASQQYTGLNTVIVGASTSELFLNNSDTLPLATTADWSYGDGSVNLSSVSREVFSARASVMLNTALQVFMCPTGFAGDLSSNWSSYGPDHIPADGLTVFSDNGLTWKVGPISDGLIIGFNTPFIAASTNATVTRHTEVYRPNYVWVILLVISTVLLFGIAMVGLSLRFATMAPNVFDPVMGLTYSNKDMPLQQAPLDADDRAKAVANERVRLGYVEDDGIQAKIIFGSEGNVSPLRKGRLYY